MSGEDHRESLAEQAAAWVPPWVRLRPEPAEPGGAEPAEPVETEPGAEPVETEPEPQAAAAPDEHPTEAEPPGPPTPPREPAHGVPGGQPDAAPQPSGPPPAGPAAEAAVPAAETAIPADDMSMMDDAELRAALEAILLVVDEPVADVVLAQVLEQPTARVAAALRQISADYTARGHGFDLRRAAGGWRLYTRPEYAAYVERFVLDGQSVRLTQAALETLAVVAYKQPVTRSRISAIRGVNVDGTIRTLVSRGLVEECGAEPDSGAFLYRTTPLFLEKLGLNSVHELPPLAPFLPDDVEEIDDAQR